MRNSCLLIFIAFLAFVACEGDKTQKSNESDNPVASAGPSPVLPGVADSMAKDPCYWCYADVFYNTYQSQIDCNNPCPCSQINISSPGQIEIMKHVDNGAILDLSKMASNTGPPNSDLQCINIEGDSLLNISLIYYLEDFCDTIDCQNKIPKPSTITSILKYNGVEQVDNKYTKVHTIESCNFKPNRCNTDSTCITSFFVDYSFKVFDYNARCTDTYCLKFIIDHEDHLTNGNNKISKQIAPKPKPNINPNQNHSHVDSLLIPICNNCGQSGNSAQK